MLLLRRHGYGYGYGVWIIVSKNETCTNKYYTMTAASSLVRSSFLFSRLSLVAATSRSTIISLPVSGAKSLHCLSNNYHTSRSTSLAAAVTGLGPESRFGSRRSGSISVMAEAESMDPVQKRLMFEDECILVDENDNVVGHDSKYNCHLMEKIEAENLLHRAFSVFLFNSKNELLLQKRSATKVTFPLVWTNTCCSHPLYRESELIDEEQLGVKNAAQRKLYDELGIQTEDVPVHEFTCLGRILYKAASDGKWGEHELDYLVFLKKDVTVQPNPEEVSDIQYVNKEQLKELIRKADAGEDGIKLSPWFRLVVDNFLPDWWDKMEQGTLADEADLKNIHKLT